MAVPTQDTTASGYLDSSFKSWIEELMRKHHVTGFSVAVISQGQIYADGYGLALLPDTKAAADTLYPMCSTTKAFTTATLGILIEEAQKSSKESLGSSKGPGLAVLQGKGWQTPVTQILPKEFITTVPIITKHATLADIASHRSGIPGHDFLWGPCQGPDLGNATRALRHLETGVELDFRAKNQYNNLMYGVLGHVIETVTGQPFDQVLRERLLTPLSMDGTWLGIELAKNAVGLEGKDKERWSRPYYYRDISKEKGDDTKKDSENGSDDNKEQGIYYPSHWTSLIGLEPAGALVSSVEDYAKWVSGLLRACKPPASSSENAKAPMPTPSTSANPLTPTLFRTVTTPLSFLPTPSPYASPLFPAVPNSQPNPMSYALGWYNDPHFLPGEILVSHGGGLPGVGTLVSFLPNHDFGIVLAGNGTGANTVIEAVAKELMGRRLGWSEERRRKHADDIKAKKAAEGEEAAAAAAKEAVEDLPGPGPAGPTTADDIPATGSSLTFENIVFAGKYHHPAYGTFVLSPSGSKTSLATSSPSFHDRDVVRPKPKAPSSSSSAAVRKEKPSNQPKSTTSPILVTPVGRRGLQYLFLLHPGTAALETRSGSRSKTVIPLGLEALISHGDFSQCAFSELDEGWGDPNDPLNPGPAEQDRKGVWEAAPVKVGGGALELESDGGQSENGSKTRTVRRLALRLARIDDDGEAAQRGDGEEGDKNKEKEKPELEEGWEDRMIWFVRALEDES